MIRLERDLMGSIRIGDCQMRTDRVVPSPGKVTDNPRR